MRVFFNEGEKMGEGFMKEGFFYRRWGIGDDEDGGEGKMR